MSDEENIEIDKVIPYLYVHIHSCKTGEKAIKQIVPANTIRKFNYEDYKKDPISYRNNKFKIRLHPDAEKQYCYVLQAEG